MAVVEDVIDRVAEIIRRVGKRDDVEDDVAQNVSFSGLANGLLAETGPVREAAIKAVSKVLTDLEIESGSDEEDAILAGIDFKEVVKGLATDPAVVETLKAAVKGILENLDSDDEAFQEAIDGAFGLNDGDKLIEVLGKEVKSELDRMVVEKVKGLVEGWDADQLEENTLNEIARAVFTPDRIAVILAGLGDEVNQAIGKFVLEMVEKADLGDSNDNLYAAVMESKSLQAAIDAAVERLVRTGKIDRLVEEVASDMLSDDDSPLRNKIQEVVSEQIVGRIAETVVGKLFDSRH